MQRDIRLRQGDTLLLQLAILQGEDDPSPGSPIDLTNAALASQVRDVMSNLIATLTVVKTMQQGVATITQSDTSLWPIGTLRCDIKVTTAGVVQHTETFGIRVEKAVTA